MADNNTIARPYAVAAFEVASDDGDLAGWFGSLDSAKALLADGQVVRFLGSPALSDAERLTFLQDLFKSADASSVMAGGKEKGTNFVKLLLEYGRVAVLPEIAEHFEALKAQVENTLDVTITSAAPLSDKDKKTFTEALKKRLGRNVNIETEIDANLIGGAVITAGDVVIDGSLRSQLQSLSNSLIA